MSGWISSKYFTLLHKRSLIPKLGGVPENRGEQLDGISVYEYKRLLTNSPQLQPMLGRHHHYRALLSKIGEFCAYVLRMCSRNDDCVISQSSSTADMRLFFTEKPYLSNNINGFRPINSIRLPSGKFMIKRCYACKSFVRSF